MKTCSKCGVEKSANDFYMNQGRLRPECKECILSANKQRRLDRKDEMNAYDRKRYADVKRYQYIERTYGLTKEGYENLLESQGGVCAICKNPPGSRSLYVDHDHSCCSGNTSCGQCVRALLCNNCNIAIAHFKDSPELMIAGASYILSFQNVLIGR